MNSAGYPKCNSMDLGVTRAVWVMAGTVVGSPQGELRIASYYKLARCIICYIRPQTEENWASRPLCHTQTSDRRVSSWVGDHQRIRAVVCFVFSFYFYFLPPLGKPGRWHGTCELGENWRACLATLMLAQTVVPSDGTYTIRISLFMRV